MAQTSNKATHSSAFDFVPTHVMQAPQKHIPNKDLAQHVAHILPKERDHSHDVKHNKCHIKHTK